VVRISSKGTACLALSVTLGLAACGDGGPTTVSEAKPEITKLAVTYSVSGGIAGISEQLVVQPDGQADLTSGSRQGRSTGHFQLADAEFANLKDKLDAAGLDSLPKPKPTGCADCFEYKIGYGNTTYSADEASLPGRLAPAIAALNDVVAAHGKDAGASVLGGK